MLASWIIPADLGTDYETLPGAADACVGASELLWAFSGRKFSGVLEVTERYCLEPGPRDVRFVPYQGVGYISPADVYVMAPWEVTHNKLRLKGKPAQEILSILTPGGTMDPDTYQLYNHSYIEFDNRLLSDIDVTYRFGQPPPAVGKMAAVQLAQQFALLWSGRESECALPSRVTSVTRQGVSWVLLDNQDFINELKTGVYAVDLFLKSVNPDKARSRARVFSPDLPRGRRKTQSS